MHSVAQLIDTSNELALAINDGAVAVASRRAVLDDLLGGQGPVRGAESGPPAVTVVSASEVEAAFHWLAAQLADGRRPRPRIIEGEPDDEPASADGLAAEPGLGLMPPRCFESVTVAELEEIETSCFGSPGPCRSNRASGAPSVTATCRSGCRPGRHRPAVRRSGPARHPAAGRLTRCGAGGPATTWPPWTPGGGRRPGPGLAGGPRPVRPISGRRPAGRPLRRPGPPGGNPVELQVTIEPELLGGVHRAGRDCWGRHTRHPV